MAKVNKEVKRMVAEKNQADAQKAEMELFSHFQVDFNAFQTEMKNKYGLAIGCRLHADEQSIKAILVPIRVPQNETATK